MFFEYCEPNDSLYSWTEFMNADGFVINPLWVIKHMLTVMDDFWEKPTLQLFWGRKEYLLKAVEIIINNYSNWFSWIELNTWCPSNTVMKTGWGSDMLKHRQETLEIIRELSDLVHSTNLTFSVKSRTWLTENDKQNQLEFLKDISKYCNSITVHWRTLQQLYTWDADFEFIRKVKEVSECPVIANGGIKDYQQAKEIEELWFDGVMIGQAAIGNPWVFTPYIPTVAEKLKKMEEHLECYIAQDLFFEDAVKQMQGYHIKPFTKKDMDYYRWKIDKDNPYHTIVEFRKYMFQAIKGFPNSKEWKQRFIWVKTYNEFIEISNQLEKEMGNLVTIE